MNDRLYEIVEIKYNPKTTTKLDFKGALGEAKQKAEELAKKNIGTRYAVFPVNNFVAEYQVYYRTTLTCPKCGEIIPIE